MRYLLRKIIFAALLGALLTLLFVVNLQMAGPELVSELQNASFAGGEAGNAVVDTLTDTINARFFGRMDLVESYAALQKLMGKREIYKFRYVKDDAGYLHDTEFYKADDPNTEAYALRVRLLQDSLAEQGTKVLFVIPPSKYRRETADAQSALPIANPEGAISKLAYYLDQYGVDTIDFNQIFPSAAFPYEDCFYRTEHYWTIPAAYEATCRILEWMNRTGGKNLDPDGRWLSPSAFEQQVYPGAMLGSDGRKCGEAYAGREDFTAIWPLETRNYERIRYFSNGREVLRGTTYDVLIDRNVVTEESGLTGRSAYAAYLGSENTHEVITNLDMPDGVSVLAIRDSYLSPVLSFLAPVCGVIDSLWSSNEDTYYSLSGTLQGGTYDFVIIEVDPYRISDDAFDFFVVEADKVLRDRLREEDDI